MVVDNATQGDKMQFESGQEISGTVKVVFAAVSNTDRTEGRGSDFDHSYYLTLEDAWERASEVGTFGRGKVESRLAIRLGDEHLIVLPEDTEAVKIGFPPDPKEELRVSGLAKLSADEKKALGLSS